MEVPRHSRKHCKKELDERYSVAKKLSEDVEKELDKKYQPSIPVSEIAPEEPGNDALWVDKKNLRLKLWDGKLADCWI